MAVSDSVEQGMRLLKNEKIFRTKHGIVPENKICFEMYIINMEVTASPPTIAQPAMNREQCVFGTISPNPTVAMVI
jgi:hypothetical protein